MDQTLRDRIQIDKITVSCNLQTGHKNSEFVALSACPNDGEFTIEEAHKVHLYLSKQVTKMAYKDALARGTMHKDRVQSELRNRMRNYDVLMKQLEPKTEE